MRCLSHSMPSHPRGVVVRLLQVTAPGGDELFGVGLNQPSYSRTHGLDQQPGQVAQDVQRILDVPACGGAHWGVASLLGIVPWATKRQHLGRLRSSHCGSSTTHTPPARGGRYRQQVEHTQADKQAVRYRPSGESERDANRLALRCGQTLQSVEQGAQSCCSAVKGSSILCPV
jgi:hypothetical protein